MNAHDKSRLLGLLFWIYTGFNLLIVILIAVVYLAIFGAVFSNVPQKPGDPPPELIFGIVVVAFAVAIFATLLFSIPKIVAGYGLRKEKPWAHTWAVVASALACMSFPLGTAVGVFGLVFLFSDEGKMYFKDAAYRAQLKGDGPVAAPLPNSWQ